MNEKLAFIETLRLFAEVGGAELYDPVYKRKGYRAGLGERALARGLADYLDDPNIPSGTEGVSWYRDLHRHMVDAVVEFRTLPKWQKLRDAYLMQAREALDFDLVDVHVGGLKRMLVARQLAYLAAVLSGEVWLKERLEGYFDAQQQCIDQAWAKFVRVGYRQLMPRIRDERHRGNKGKFGSTTLLTYSLAGRVMFTFQRSDESVTYVADDSDMHGERSGPNATATPFVECISMINEVTDNWDLSAMRRDDKIGFG